LIRKGKDAAIITTGGMVYRAVQAWQNLKEKGLMVQVINISCLSDLDREAITKPLKQESSSPTKTIISKPVWESLIANFLAEHRLGIHFRKLGINNMGVLVNRMTSIKCRAWMPRVLFRR